MVGKQDQESKGGNHDIGRVATLDEVSRRAVRGSRVATQEDVSRRAVEVSRRAMVVSRRAVEVSRRVKG